MRQASISAAARCAALGICLSATLSVATGDDWPMFGRDATRNGISPEKNPPHDWQVERRDAAGNLIRPSRNISWQAELGSVTFGDPVVASGLVWVGTNNWQPGNDKAEDASVLACFRESDGKLMYRYVSPRLPQGRVHDWPFSAMACSPLVEDERLWFTTNRAEVVCLDIGELQHGEGQPREVWKLDMMQRFGVKPCGSRMMLAHLCSIATYRDLIYVITGNGVDETWLKLPAPEAPSVVCLSKITGEVIWQDNSPGANILSGQWSSPLVIVTEDRAQVVVPQGDGWLRSFDALTGKLIWKFDINKKSSTTDVYGRGERNTITATPVYYGGRVYVASGNYAEFGEGPARLICIDPAKTGDISSELAVNSAGRPVEHKRLQAIDAAQGERAVPNPNSGLIWEYVGRDRNGDGKTNFEEEFHRTSANVAIKDGLLVVADWSGLIHCLDAKTGQFHWNHDCLAAIYASPLIVGDKVYIADEDGDVLVFNLDANPKIALRNKALDNPNENNMDSSVLCSPIYANGTLYVASRNRLYAIQDQGSEPGGFWPQWRGPTRDNLSTDTGLLQVWSEGGPPLVWRANGLGQGIASVALAEGRLITVGSSGDHEKVIALNETSGELLWTAPIGPAINDAPLMRWLSQRTPTVDGDRLYVSTFQGDLICLQTADGKELWRKNYPRDYDSKRRSWGFVDYPLVDGNHVICTPGGTDATVAALNKRTGELVWKCLLDPPELGSYAAAMVTEGPGTRHYVFVLSDSLVGVRASDGKLLWRHDSRGLGWINSLTPLIADGVVILPGGRGSAAETVTLELKRDGDGVIAKEIGRTKFNLDHFQDSTLRLGDYLYAVAYNGLPICANWRTGKVLWGPMRTGAGKAALTYADQRLYLLHGDGTLRLVEATPEAYRERGKLVLADHERATGATFPVITGGRLYVRSNDHLFCFDVRQPTEGYKPPAPRQIEIGLAAAKFPSSGLPIRAKAAPPPAAQNKQPDAIFVPTPHDIVAKMLEVAGVQKTDVVYDLGSGDGRVVIAAAKTYGARGVGVELDKDLVQQSLDNVKKAGVEGLSQIELADLFTKDLSDADVIALYLPPKLMDRLLPQLTKLKPGARIVSHYFKFTGIPPDKSLRFDSRDDGDSHEIYLWSAPLGKVAP